MKNLAIIPARGGSKRIPRKNIKPFLGKPIMVYSIEAALECGLFEEVMVSTDDEEIASTAKRYGASIPFKRSVENAGDSASQASVMHETIEGYEKVGRHFDNFCCLMATAPFITPDLLKKAYVSFLESGCDTLFSIQEFSYTIYRALEYDAEGFLKMVWPENQPKHSQEFNKAFHDAGQFYFSRIASFKKNRIFAAGKAKGFLLSEMDAHDIDSQEDWETAELKYQLIHGKKQ